MGHDRGGRAITGRALLRRAGALGLGAAVAPLTARAQAPMIGRGLTLTVSTWGGVTQDGVKAYVQPEFEKRTGATLAYDIGGQGARYNKLLAQRANPPADVFFSTDEAVVAGPPAGVLTSAARESLSNLSQLPDWGQGVEEGATETPV